MTTMTLTQAAQKLVELRIVHGDVPIVLWDLDSGCYFPLKPECFEAQVMEGGTVRISVGPEGGYDQDVEPYPVKRPL